MRAIVNDAMHNAPSNLVHLESMGYLETRMRENVNAKKNADERNKAKKSEKKHSFPMHKK